MTEIKPLYQKIETAKNGTQIPVLYNGKTIDSKYNPEREADTILTTITQNFNFFILLGVGSGILLQKLSILFSDAKIICIERTKADLHFLSQLESVNKLCNNPNIFFTDFLNAENVLVQNYIPAKYGDIKIIEQRAWVNENIDIYEQIKQSVEHSLRIISADYSVQVHFGKIWQKNIMNNLKLLTSADYQIDNSKNAYIIAAGPTLDKTIKLIKEDAHSLIISTDTAFSTLLKNKIIPDIVISLDGQSVSYNHYIHKFDFSKTIFAFDLCGNNSAIKKIISNDGKVFFFRTGHPLSLLADNFSNNSIPQIFAGSGTITIAALDLAVKCGFNTIKILGADFSYSNVKAYTQGTYLDVLYNKNSNRLNSTEKQFSRLMYRTELIKNKDKTYTNDVLNAYRFSMEQYLKQNNINFVKENNIYTLNNTNQKTIQIKNSDFSFADFVQQLTNLNQSELEIPLLPYIAWLKNKKSLPYDELLKLAHSTIVRYN